MEVHCPHLRTKLMKGNGFHNISIKMIQICGESIVLPLKSIFETALKEKKIQIFEK